MAMAQRRQKGLYDPKTPAGESPFDHHVYVLASDGGVVHLRPVVPDDADAVVEFHAGLSERTRYLRYFGPHPRISQRELDRFTVVDQLGEDEADAEDSEERTHGGRAQVPTADPTATRSTTTVAPAPVPPPPQAAPP